MDLSYSKSERKAEWMTTSREILPHLSQFSAKSGEASVVFPSIPRLVSGSLGTSEGSRYLVFRPCPLYDSILPPPPPRISVRVDYEQKADAYNFFSRVAGTDPTGHWFLMPPRAIEKSDRRLVVRYPVLGDPEFRLEIRKGREMREMPIYDLSTEGVSFALRAEEGLAKPGDIIEAELSIPNQPTLGLYLGITNLRPMETIRHFRSADRDAHDEPQDSIAGARFLGMESRDRHLLALAISLWDIMRKTR